MTKQAWTSWWMVMRFYSCLICCVDAFRCRRCAPKSYSKRKLSTFSRDLTLSSRSPSKSMQQTKQAWTSWWMVMRFYSCVICCVDAFRCSRCAPKSYSKRKLSTFSRDLTLSSRSPSKSMQQTNQAWTSWWMVMRFYPCLVCCVDAFR